MFKEFFLFELKQAFKRPGVYIYFLIFFLITLLMGAAMGGLITGAVNDTNTQMTSASVIGMILTEFSSDFLLGFITLIVIVAVISTAVYKDFQHNTHALFFTKPITKFGYLAGRFLANYLVAAVVMSGAVFGFMVACLLVPADNPAAGPVHLANFFQPFFIFTVPNTLLMGSIFFSLVTFTRNITTGYVSSLVLIILLGIANSITSDLENKTAAALLEPFGGEALNIITEYWTPEEQNTRLIPLSGVLLGNRLLWLGISLLITGLTFYKFKFSQFTSPVSLFKKKTHEGSFTSSKPIHAISDIPKAAQDFSLSFSLYQFRFITGFELKKMLKSVFFPIIILVSVLFTVVATQVMDILYGTETYPVTYQMLDVGAGSFRLFIMVLIVFYAGILIWREKDARVDELVGTSPVKSWVLFASKFTALLALVSITLIATMITCIILQAYAGYTNFEIGLYITDLFGFRLIGLAIVCALALAIQVFVNNKYVGFTLATVILVGLPVLYNAIDFENPLARFNSSGNPMIYSDMNGYGHTNSQFFIYKAYWIGFILIMLSLALAMWQRGKEKNYKARWAIARSNFKKGNKILLALGTLFFLGFGSYIYYNIKVLNKYATKEEQEVQTAEFEKKYKQYETDLQPRVVESNLKVDIYPQQLGATIKGFYYLKNKFRKPIKNIFVNQNTEVELKQLALGNSSRFVDDKEMGFYGFKLNSPLLPGDSLKLEFEISAFEKGFSKNGGNTQVIYNGSFFNSGILPSIGYSAQSELEDNATRKKYKLAPKPRMAAVGDSVARMNTYISGDADWIRFEAVVSTDQGQTALAPGYLQKDWKENGRHFFHYKMDSNILNFYAFLSAKYEVKKDKWNDVNIEIYYHKGHEYNVDRMIKGIKRSLDYYTKNFSPYQHRQVRILEFPRYSTFAQSFPNTIPFSEGIGFIAKVDEKDPLSIDYPFYVTAHEVAHQWWAHQVIGGDVQGSTLMCETMSQYSALMVMEKEFGPKAMKKFLKYEMDDYLQGRTQEKKKEVPLMLVENQQYIHYNKGSVVMYALKDYIGEDSLNSALRRYIKKTAFQEPPFTNSIEFVNEIRRSTPDSLQNVITDLFEKITLFENTMKSLSYTKEANGKYKVKLNITAKKFQADSVGKQKEITINDWVDVGVFKTVEKDGKKEEKVLFMKKMKINKASQTIELLVDEEPESAGIDPYNKLIDRSPDNNIKSFKGGETETADGGGGNVIVIGG